MQIGEEIVGVRIAVRDIAEGQEHKPESQIYNWGIKRDASLDGAQPVNNDSSRDISSDTSNNNILELTVNVKREHAQKETATQSEVVPFISKDSDIKAAPFIKEKDGMRIIGANKSIDEKAFVEGMWEDSPNSAKDIVENSRLESVENVEENGIIEETVDNDTGVSGEYTTTIGWSIFKKLPARPVGAGYYTKKIKQHNARVEAYEIKINPNKEGYHVKHPDGRYVQFENMVNNILQDGKCVLNKNRSFYHVYDKGDLAKNRVLQQANRQIEVASAVGYKVEWLVSDVKAVAQLSRLFKENNVNITVKYYPE